MNHFKALLPVRKHSSRVGTRDSSTDGWGIVKGYVDGQNGWHDVSPGTREKLRKAMGAREERDNQVVLLPAGESKRLPQAAELTLEDGTQLPLRHSLPRDLPIGYHTLKIPGRKVVIQLIVHPRRCHSPEKSQARGWAVQLYSLRSRRSWGMGDFADLRRFARWSRQKLGTNFLLLNPLGAPLPVTPINASPYYPSSRLFLNPLYLCVEEVPGAAHAGPALEKLAAAGQSLNTERLINRDAVARLKMSALEKIHGRFRGHRDYDRFCTQQGDALRHFAVFCVLAEHHASGWQQWPKRFRHPDSAAVREFASRHAARRQFHQWLQWQLDVQFARAARELPLMLDVPVGVSPDGFDAWLWQDMLALDVSVGAPPDAFNSDGQSWGLPPFIPHRLRASGYAPFRQTIHAMLRHAKGLRIDHVMGLFRLFWIPPGEKAQAGGYVRYNADELLAVLAIESQRSQAMIVGEDLGTVEHGVRSRLRRQGVLSYRLFWFEKKPPAAYPPQALAALTTHDLFTVAGLWSGEDVEAQRRAGLHPNTAGAQAIRRHLARAIGLPKTASPQAAILGAHRLLTRTPCRLITATLDDALAVEERPNMPGTTTQWPNWCLALPKPLEEIQKDEFVRKLAKVMKNR
jgi:4-alpha-glucanotransferase